jgi:hypothetical protein
MRELLANPTAIHEARALLAEQIGKFTLERVEARSALKPRTHRLLRGRGSYTGGWADRFPGDNCMAGSGVKLAYSKLPKLRTWVQ